MSDPLAALRARFLARARQDLEALRRSDRDPQAVGVVAHRLSGAAGVFGFPEVSRLAAVVDDQLHAGEGLDVAALGELIAGLEALPDPSASA